MDVPRSLVGLRSRQAWGRGYLNNRVDGQRAPARRRESLDRGSVEGCLHLGGTIEDLYGLLAAAAHTSPAAGAGCTSLSDVRHPTEPDEPEHMHRLRNDVHKGNAGHEDKR